MKRFFAKVLILCLSFAAVAADSDQQALLQAHTDLFRSVLKGVRQSLSVSPPTSLFISYSHDDEIHKRRVEALCEDLTNIGIPTGNIIFDQWSNRPGGHTDIYQNIDKILGAEKVVLVGSPPLREKYEAIEQRGIVCNEISRLRDRIEQKGQEGIIPVWFEENFEVCFPQGIRHIVGRSLSEDYHASFFDLVIDIYQLDANDNPVKFLKQQFMERRNVPEAILRGYGDRLRRFQEEKSRKEEETVREIFEAAHREREKYVGLPSDSVYEIQELEPYNRGGSIEITPENREEVKRLMGLKQQAFKGYDRGIHIKNWKSSIAKAELLEFLLRFKNIKKLKVGIEWERENHEEGVIEIIERATGSYTNLGNLDLSSCRLTDELLLKILEGLRDGSQLKILNIRKNYFKPGIIDKIKARVPGLLELEIENDEYPPVTAVIPWEEESRGYFLFQRAKSGYLKDYNELMAIGKSTDDPVIISYCAQLIVRKTPEQGPEWEKRINLVNLRQRAIQGDAEAQNCYGLHRKVLEDCYRWLRIASMNGFKEADCNLAIYARKLKDKESARERFERACARDHIGAHIELASLRFDSYEDLDVTRDLDVMAAEFAPRIGKAAQLGDLLAQMFAIKICKTHGKGLPDWFLENLRKEGIEIMGDNYEAAVRGIQKLSSPELLDLKDNIVGVLLQ